MAWVDPDTHGWVSHPTSDDDWQQIVDQGRRHVARDGEIGPHSLRLGLKARKD